MERALLRVHFGTYNRKVTCPLTVPINIHIFQVDMRFFFLGVVPILFIYAIGMLIISVVFVKRCYVVRFLYCHCLIA